MIPVIIVGAVFGAGLFLLGFALLPQRASLARQIAALEAARGDARPALRSQDTTEGGESQFSRWLDPVAVGS